MLIAVHCLHKCNSYDIFVRLSVPFIFLFLLMLCTFYVFFLPPFQFCNLFFYAHILMPFLFIFILVCNVCAMRLLVRLRPMFYEKVIYGEFVKKKTKIKKPENTGHWVVSTKRKEFRSEKCMFTHVMCVKCKSVD